MSLIALTGAKSAGITTSALALTATWPGPLLLTECDPAGGDVAAGLLRGAEAGPGLLELALATRRGLTQDQFWEHTTALSGDGTLRLLAGLSDPAQHATLSPAWPLLTRMLRALSPLGSPAEGKPNDVDVLADCGRFAAGTPYGLLAAADLVLLVLRPTLSHVAHTRNRLADLQGQLAAHAGGPPPELGLLIVDAGPYPPNEVAAALGVAVAGVLANDAESAAVLAGLGESRARFEKSPLMRSEPPRARRWTPPGWPMAAPTTPPAIWRRRIWRRRIWRSRMWRCPILRAGHDRLALCGLTSASGRAAPARAWTGGPPSRSGGCGAGNSPPAGSCWAGC